MQIRKNDNVKILSGKDRGKTGKVLRVFPAEAKILVEGINLRKKHVRPREQGKKGQIVEIPALMQRSAVMLVCPSCGKPARFGSASEGGKKVRICKKCKATS
jgi:large subunit ribosomal protein L24